MGRCIYCGHDVAPTEKLCPRCGMDQRDGGAIRQPGLPHRERTITDPAGGVLNALRGRTPTLPDIPHDRPVDDDTHPFRPRRRAPAAILCVLDDLSESGERVWIRTSRCVIGGQEKPDRVLPDLMISNDDGISTPHAELQRRWDEGGYRWTLRDLESVNGTYLRIESAPLRHGDRVLIGHRAFRFDVRQSLAHEVTGAGPPGDAARTRGLDFDPAELTTIPPELVEVRTGDAAGLRFVLDQDELRIGRSDVCEIVLSQDPTVSPMHARLLRNERGMWSIEDADSRNGLWLRIREKELGPYSEFQLGQQRFTLAIPDSH